jgi:hypothetical protein
VPSVVDAVVGAEVIEGDRAAQASALEAESRGRVLVGAAALTREQEKSQDDEADRG